MLSSAITVFSVLLSSFCALTWSKCPETAEIGCPCGPHEPPAHVGVKVKLYSFIANESNVHICKPLPEDTKASCDRLKKCDYCPMGIDGPECVTLPRKRWRNNNDRYEEIKAVPSYPVQIKMPPGGGLRKKRHEKRASDEEDNEAEDSSDRLNGAKEELELMIEPFDEPGEPEDQSEPEPLKSVAKPEPEQYEDYYHNEDEEDPDHCKMFSELGTAEVKCWMWPTYITCEETCISGYKIDGQTSRSAKCTYKKPDEWLPKPLEECSKVKNCHVKLISPGTIKCHLMTVEHPHCYIACEPYDHHEYVPLREYECVEEYQPALPHCAILDPKYDVKP